MINNDETLKYPSNPLGGAIENGAMMDLRLRIAVDFLRQSPMYQGTLGVPEDLAKHALDMATEILRLGEERGLIEPMPDHGDLSRRTKNIIERNIRAQLFQNEVAQIITRNSIQAAPAGMTLNG